MLLPVHVDTSVLLTSFSAYTFFNDTFRLTQNGVNIPITSTGISWPGDKGEKYKKGPNSALTQWIDPEN
jgi:hypothetical protein